MPEGPGKYDDVATKVMEETSAESVVLVIVGGKLGAGCSIKIGSALARRALPGILRAVADDIERGTP